MSVHNPRNYLPLADGQLADSAVEKLLRQLADLLVHGAPQPEDEGRATQKSDRCAVQTPTWQESPTNPRGLIEPSWGFPL
jgi:hypothetical protein